MKHSILPVLALVVLALAIGLVQLAVPAQAATPTLYVSPIGNDSNSCTTSTAPCKTITGALNKGGSMIISVAAGTYKENLSISSYVVISGTTSTGTIIDGSGSTTLPAISVTGSHFTLDDVTVRNGGGGGLIVSGNITSVMSIKNSIFDSNHGSAGGAITNHGATMSINRVSIVNNTTGGGGVYNDSGGAMVIVQSAIISSTAGGGIYNNAATLDVVNSTVANNSGGGITNVGGGTLGLYSVTIATNPGGPGLSNSGTVTLTDTLIASNGGPSTSPDCSGTVNSLGYNLVQNATGCSGLTATGDIVGVNAGLYPLAKNNGFTMTEALAQGSPAVDHGNPTGCTDNTGAVLTQDQRGMIRPIGSACDIGAFELQFQTFLPMVFR